MAWNLKNSNRSWFTFWQVSHSLIYDYSKKISKCEIKVLTNCITNTFRLKELIYFLWLWELFWNESYNAKVFESRIISELFAISYNDIFFFHFLLLTFVFIINTLSSDFSFQSGWTKVFSNYLEMRSVKFVFKLNVCDIQMAS